MGGSIGVAKNFYDNSISDEEGYYSIDGMGKGVVKEEVEKFDIEHIAQHRFGLVNSSVLDVPYINRYPFNEYRYMKKLGIGKTSIVYKATSVKDEKERFAIKEIKVSELKRQEFEDFRYELNILSQLSHPSIMKLHSVYDSGGPNSKFFLILEYLKGGELVNAILQNRHYSEVDVIHFANQIISGIQYLHSRGVVHGNLIPENIVLANQRFSDRINNHVKIVGFDSMETIQHRRNQIQFQPNGVNVDTKKRLLVDEQFRAPELMELFQSENLCTSREADIWSFGVFLYILLSGQLPFPHGKTAVLHPISSFTDSKWDKISFVAKELLCKLLHPEPQSRYNASDAKCHPWILADEKISPENSSQVSETSGNVETSNYSQNDESAARKKVSSTAKSVKPLLTLNHNLNALEEFQRKRYFYLEGYRSQNSSNILSPAPPERLTIYRFMSEDLSKEVANHKLSSLNKEVKGPESPPVNDEKA